MIRNKLNLIIWLINQIITIIRITYSISFWQNFRKNWTCWIKFISNGYFILERRDNDGTVVIQSVFFLLGDINVHIRSNFMAKDFAEIVSFHIKEMQKFKEQVFFFIPVVISLFLNIIPVFYVVYQITLLFHKIS